MWKNKLQILLLFLDANARNLHSSIFAHQKDKTIVLCVPKQYQNIILFSLLEEGEDIFGDYEGLKKPQINFYNLIKSGVDIVNHLKIKKIVFSLTLNRWPMQVFYVILDIAGINYLIYRINTNYIERRKQKLLLTSYVLHKC